jgi:hypothetical protein
MLDDLPSHERLEGSTLSEIEVQRMQRAILRYKQTPGVKHWIMVFVWQFPSMTMAYAWCTFIAGLTVYLCSPIIENLPWQEKHKVCLAELLLVHLLTSRQIAIVYLSFSLIGLMTYISATIFVFAGEEDHDSSIASSSVRIINDVSTNTLGNRGTNSNKIEAEVMSNKIGNQMEATRNRSGPTVGDKATYPVQAVRSKVLIGFEQFNPPRRDAERSKRQLLY